MAGGWKCRGAGTDEMTVRWPMAGGWIGWLAWPGWQLFWSAHWSRKKQARKLYLSFIASSCHQSFLSFPSLRCLFTVSFTVDFPRPFFSSRREKTEHEEDIGFLFFKK